MRKPTVRRPARRGPEPPAPPDARQGAAGAPAGPPGVPDPAPLPGPLPGPIDPAPVPSGLDAAASALLEPADLVAALWREVPPAFAPAPGTAADRAWAALDRLVADAEAVVRGGGAADPRAAALLADTARTVVAVLADASAAATPARTPAGGLASPVRLRLARMEHWLATRAADDVSAAPSADLCLWVLEHLEADVR
jgi:hypothetical protein